MKNDYAVYGGVWNDYTEYRNTSDAKPGEVIIENGDGTLHKSHSRLEPEANIMIDILINPARPYVLRQMGRWKR